MHFPCIKSLLFFAFIFLCGNRCVANSADTLVPDGANYLEMRGKVLRSEGQQRDDEKVLLDSAEIHVTNESGKEVFLGLTDSKGKLSFRLPLYRKFTVAISKKGFVQKKIFVDTHLPASEAKNYVFAFDADIFEKVEGLDVSILDQPVAKISFRLLEKSFTYDAAYTNKINSGLQKMYREYYALKKNESAANDSVPSKPITVKSSGTSKSVPYGKGTKPH